MKNWIASLFTGANLLCGCISIHASTSHELILASIWIALGGAFDLVDGAVARMLRADSSFGKELDSLSDVVTFGVAPSFILYTMLTSDFHDRHPLVTDLIPYLAFTVALFAALRLARFNTADHSINSFNGLPTPACALFIASLPFIRADDNQSLRHISSSPTGILITVAVLNVLMVSKLKLLSLKFNSFHFKDNYLRYALLIGAIALALLFQFRGAPIIFIFYILLSVLNFYFPYKDHSLKNEKISS